jgi:hypothetical protein
VTWETAELEGGPADGTRVRVTDRPLVLQVTTRCAVDKGTGQSEGGREGAGQDAGQSADDGVREGADHGVAEGTAELCVEAVYIYRRMHAEPPLRYGWDWASP